MTTEVRPGFVAERSLPSRGPEYKRGDIGGALESTYGSIISPVYNREQARFATSTRAFQVTTNMAELQGLGVHEAIANTLFNQDATPQTIQVHLRRKNFFFVNTEKKIAFGLNFDPDNDAGFAIEAIDRGGYDNESLLRWTKLMVIGQKERGFGRTGDPHHPDHAKWDRSMANSFLKVLNHFVKDGRLGLIYDTDVNQSINLEKAGFQQL